MNRTPLHRFAKLALGLCMLVGLILTLMFAPPPPGAPGAVIRHNRAAGIDATPLIYSDLDHMSDLEEGVRRMRETFRHRSN